MTPEQEDIMENNDTLEEKEEKLMEEPEKTDKTDKEQKPWLFKKGESGNPEGRPKGAKGFKTIFEEAVKKIAKEKQIDPNSIEVDLVIKAIAGARGGDYRYYKDIFDRIYGQPKQALSLGLEDSIDAVEIIIKGKNETNIKGGQKHNESISEKSERVAGEKEPSGD